MAITRYSPNTIWLGGERVDVNDVVASEAITPGHLIERFNSSGTPKFRKHATAGGKTAPIIALDQSMMNKGVDDAYAADDLVDAAVGMNGSTFWALIASGQNIAAGEQLESAGDGTLRILASGEPLFTCLEGVNNSAGPSTARIKVETI